jgi:hypothetical protein
LSEVLAGTGAFQLSRIHAEGWNAAKKLLASSAGRIDPAEAAIRNPYHAPEARARWTRGFVEAIGSGATASAKRRGNSWRRAATRPASGGEQDE